MKAIRTDNTFSTWKPQQYCQRDHEKDLKAVHIVCVASNLCLLSINFQWDRRKIKWLFQRD